MRIKSGRKYGVTRGKFSAVFNSQTLVKYFFSLSPSLLLFRFSRIYLWNESSFVSRRQRATTEYSIAPYHEALTALSDFLITTFWLWKIFLLMWKFSPTNFFQFSFSDAFRDRLCLKEVEFHFRTSADESLMN